MIPTHKFIAVIRLCVDRALIALVELKDIAVDEIFAVSFNYIFRPDIPARRVFDGYLAAHNGRIAGTTIGVADPHLHLITIMGTGIFLKHGADVGSFRGKRGCKSVMISRLQRFSLVDFLARRQIRISLVPTHEAIAVFRVCPEGYFFAFAYKVVG